MQPQDPLQQQKQANEQVELEEISSLDAGSSQLTQDLGLTPKQPEVTLDADGNVVPTQRQVSDDILTAEQQRMAQKPAPKQLSVEEAQARLEQLGIARTPTIKEKQLSTDQERAKLAQHYQDASRQSPVSTINFK